MDQHMETATAVPHHDNDPPCDEQQHGSDGTVMKTTPQSTTGEDGNEEEIIPSREATSFTGIAVPNTLSSADLPLDNQVVSSDAKANTSAFITPSRLS